MKTLIKLALAALVLHATWRSAEVYWRYYQFKDEVKETAQFGAKNTPEQIQNRVMELASRHSIPLDPEHINVRRDGTHTGIDAVYTDRVELIPTKFYPWEFTVSVDAFTLVAKDPKLPGDR
jgi:hypothetical protein